ncbi:sodium/myo-inositol cotransporter 2 isoform X2 [Entelurus aequoreus]|uniref:sodium/myo-inositol cotransporter 2 isoform X2 n=1 Tax=Entelurus aequoreus TaxID=161455 RepID=UPI002B1E66E6|nr:sodium/myo-inositol cotransporter 2 isoform X2 [Entelurus aequoreus]
MLHLQMFEHAVTPQGGSSVSTTASAAGGGSTANFEAVDIVVLVLYFVLVLAVGFWSMWRTKRSTVDGYFLAGKSMTWWPVGASLFASNIGSGHLIGLAGSGAAAGIGAIAYEWNGLFMVLLLGWIFLPIYLASGVTTMPEYLQRRFGGRRTQLFIAVLSLFIYIFTKISVDMYAGALFIQLALQWNIYLAVVLLLSVTALYTVAGGLATVIYTDAAQTVIMLAGTLILMGFSFVEVGGWNALMTDYPNAIPSVRVPNSTCGIPREDAFHIFRDPVTSDLPWPGVIVGMSIPSMWYWCSDQVIVQRSLAAKTLTHAKGGSLLAAYLKLLPFFAIMLPGMISRILYTGLRGLMMAVMIAALVSSLTSIFNSASTIFTMDLWKTFRSSASEWELMIVGRVFVLVLVVASILWIPVVQASQGGQLFIYIQAISTNLQPPVSIVFLMGCFWKRTNEKGAFWGLVVGLLVGCMRMLLDFIYPAPLCFERDNRPAVIKDVHYLYFSVVLSLITLVVVVGVSLATEEPTAEQINGLTWFTRFVHVERKELNSELVTPQTAEVAGRPDESSERRESTTPSGRRPSRLVSALYWLCGMDTTTKEGQKMPEIPAEPERNKLEENPCLQHLVNANLIICLSVAAFVIGYWA